MSENKTVEKENKEGFISFAEYSTLAKDDEYAPGWVAIDEACKEVYGDQEPKHFGTLLTSRAMLGGNEYLDGYSIYKSNHGYFHIVTYGMSELYSNVEAYGNEFSKWGYELTMKVKADQVEDLYWAMNMLGNLARYTFTSGSFFQENEFVLGDGSPIKQGSDSKLASLLISKDTELKGRDTVHGQLDFLQVVGITFLDAQEIQKGGGHETVREVLAKMKVRNPFLVTDLDDETTYL